MASLSLPRVLSQRRSGSIEVERETFWKSQTTSIGKAINHHETPVKEKHVRSAIIGTYHEKGGTTFWAVVGTLPIQENPIVCWKFCHTLHKLIREGHPNVLPESQAYRQRIRELGKYWGHLRHNFGRLIACYCRLLASKLEFHLKNPKFPGNLQVTNEQLEAIGEMDINNYFQITVEMFDFMDEILTLQAAVFGSLESGRANSMTMSGQCRLAPLIPCIQDSSHLYDYLVKLLFKLHSSLPPDVLLGHRDRFYKQFKVLRDFYKNASILQYFKHLIQIPLLPDDPPNFLIKSEIHSHVSPVVILPPQDDTADTDSVDMSLVDTSSPPLLELEPTNGVVAIDINAERDRLIERLQQEIERLKREIQRIRMEDQQLMDELRHELAATQGKLNALQQQLLAKNGEIETLRSKAVSAEKNVQAAEKLVEAEKKAKTNEDKFQKMKDVYYKLREEHIGLLRAKADVEKQLVGAKQASQNTDKDKSASSEEVTTLKRRLEEAEKCQIKLEKRNKELKSKSEEMLMPETAEMLAKSTVDEVDVKRSRVSLKERAGNVVEDRSRLEAMLRQSVEINRKLNETLHNEHQIQTALMATERSIDSKLLSKSEIERDLERKIERCSSEIGQLSSNNHALTKERMELDDKLAALANEQMDLESNFHHNPQQSILKLETLKKCRDELEKREAEVTKELQQTVTFKQSAETDLNQTMETANAQLVLLDKEIDQLQREKSELEEKLEVSTAAKTELNDKLAKFEALLNKRSADAFADNQEMDEMLMMAVDEMYLVQDQMKTSSEEHGDTLKLLKEEKLKLEKRVKELETAANLNIVNEVDFSALSKEESYSNQESSVSTLQEDKKKLNANKRDLENKLTSVLSDELELKERLRRNKNKQLIGVFADAEDEERRELEEMLLAAIDENYIAQQLMDESSADADERFQQLERERKNLQSKVMLLEGKLDNALIAKNQIEESFKGSSSLNAQEIAKLIEIKNQLDERVRTLTEEMQKVEENSPSNCKEDLMLDNSELEELLMAAVDEAHIAEQILQEQSQQMEDQYAILYQERSKLRTKVLELEGRLANTLNAKSSIENAFLNATSLTSEKLVKIIAAKNEVEEKEKNVTEQLQKLLVEKEEATHQHLEQSSRLEIKNKELEKENSEMEAKLEKIKQEKNTLELSLLDHREQSKKQLDKMTAKHRELDSEKQELEEMLLAALDEKYMTEQTASEEEDRREMERSELIKQHKALKLKSMELEGRLTNALNAKSAIEQAFQASSSTAGKEMAQAIYDKQSLEVELDETVEKLEKTLAEKEIAEKRAQEKIYEATKQVSELLREKQELELKNLALEESLTLMSSEKAVYETNLHQTSQRLAKELQLMEQKHGDLDLEKQELEEMLLAAVDETYVTEEILKAQTMDVEEEKTQLIQERNILRRRVMELEGKFENAQAAKNTIQQAFQDNSAKLGQQIASLTSEKYILEDEILSLRMQLSSESDSRMQAQQTQLDSVEKLVGELRTNVLGLEQQLLEVTEQKIALEQQVADLTGNIARLESEGESVKKDLDETKLKNTDDRKRRQFEILVSCIEEAEVIVKNALKTVDDEATTPLTCSPEYLLKCGGSVLETLERLKNDHFSFSQDKQADVDALLRSVTAFSHELSQFLIEGKATFNATADIEQGTHLLNACKDSGNDTLLLLNNMKTCDNNGEVLSGLSKVDDDLRRACDAVESLISLSAAKVEDRIEDLVEKELSEMDRAIEEAASRIAEILSKSRQAETGVKLEVSEKILDACTALMESIRLLVKRSKELQLEIVAQGKGRHSVKEFYKKNHQWTEGLLSAAKAVGMGAKFLVDAADKVVTGQAKFELLVAASQEVAASTAQLVVASKVKADPGSKNLKELSKASSSVRGCTGTVVATVKDCAQMIDDADVMDFAGLSLHQAKRLEMESQVRVLELETSLEKERVKLAGLRKRHYTLAGPGAGWDESAQ